MLLTPWLGAMARASRLHQKKPVRPPRRAQTLMSRLTESVEEFESRVLLSTLFVNSFADVVDATPGDGFSDDGSGLSTLRAAIMEANALPGADTIVLGAGIYRFNLPGFGEDAAATGDLDITGDLTIQGADAETTFIDAVMMDRVFDVRPGATLVLVNVTVTGGAETDLSPGGAVRNDGGNLTITNSHIQRNASNEGGGIYNSLGTLTITGSELTENAAVDGGNGGAIFNNGGTVNIVASSVYFNSAENAGGAVYNNAGVVNVTNSTISNNNVGTFAAGQGDGGGFFNSAGGTLTLNNSTVAFNFAGRGGGVTNEGTINFGNTILAENGDENTISDGFNMGGTINSLGSNLVSSDDNFTFPRGLGDIVGTAMAPIMAGLEPLNYNGGDTPVHRLMFNSPALDAGNNGIIPPAVMTDQRGAPRIRDGNRDMTAIVDIGAFEMKTPADFFVDNVPSPIIINGMAGDFRVDNDTNMLGILDAGDEVTFQPSTMMEVNFLIFGDRAFSSINAAVAQATANGDPLDEIIIGAGTYNESITISDDNLELRGATGDPMDVVINPSATGLQISGDFVHIDSLTVNGAGGTGIDVNKMGGLSRFSARNVVVTNSAANGIRSSDVNDVSLFDVTSSNNMGDGIFVSGSASLELDKVTAKANSGNGVLVQNVTQTADVVQLVVMNNGGRGLEIESTETVALADLVGGMNTDGNALTNVNLLIFKPSEGEQNDDVTLTATELQHTRGGMLQEALDLNALGSAIIQTGAGDDTVTVDFGHVPVLPTGELLVDGGAGFDQFSTQKDADFVLTDTQLQIAGATTYGLYSVAGVQIGGGVSANSLDASAFSGNTTLLGGDGDDTLIGGSGDDALDGGAGADILDGGTVERVRYQPAPIAFESIDLVAGGMDVTSVLADTLSGTAPIALGGDTFTFYGQNYSGTDALYVSPHGLITFQFPFADPENNDFVTAVEPPMMTGSPPIMGPPPMGQQPMFKSPGLGPALPSPAIAPLWDSWVTGTGSAVSVPDAQVLFKFEDIDADGNNDRLIIEWNQVLHAEQILFNDPMPPTIDPSAIQVTFQAILQLNTGSTPGDITFNYVSLDTGDTLLSDGKSATVGLKDMGEPGINPLLLSFDSSNGLVGDSKSILLQGNPSNGNDFLNSGDGYDSLVSGSGDDTLDAGSGNDELNAGPGNDNLQGGIGDDVFQFQDGWKTAIVNDTAGNDAFDFTSLSTGLTVNISSVNVTDTNGNTVTHTGNGIEFITGTNNDDTFNVLAVGGSELTLDGLDGNDTFNVIPSASIPINILGGTQTGADVLNVDAQAAVAANTGSAVLVTGFEDVVYSNIEQVNITNAKPVFGNASPSFSISENRVSGAMVGSVMATDPEPSDVLTYAIVGGDDGGTFAINSSTGVISIADATQLDSTTTPVYMLSVEVADVGRNTATATVTVNVKADDFGDAPDSYGTLFASNGPHHFRVPGFFLGNSVDSEADGQVNATATGDDNAGNDSADEDGVTILTTLATSSTTSITRTARVRASQPGKLDAWIDFNANGQFDMSEHLGGGTSFTLVAGLNLVEFTVPAGSFVGNTFARFRFSSAGGLTPNGFAPDGEVEDYQVTIVDQSATAPTNQASGTFETALNTAVGQFFAAFPEELQNPDGMGQNTQLPIAATASGGAAVAGNNLGRQTDPALQPTVEPVNQLIGRSARPFENVFVLVIHPVDFVLTDPQGRQVGFTETGGFVNEIGMDVSYSGDGVVELLTIQNAEAGRYNLELVGVGTIFRGGASLVTADGEQTITFEGSLIADQNFDLALDYSDPLNQSIPARTGLTVSTQNASLGSANLNRSNNASDLALSTTAAQQIQNLQSQIDNALSDPEPNRANAFGVFLQWMSEINQSRRVLMNSVQDSLDLPFLDSLTVAGWLKSDDAAANANDNANPNLNSFWLGLTGSLTGVPSELFHLGEFLGDLIPSTPAEDDDSSDRRSTADDGPNSPASQPSRPTDTNANQPTRRDQNAKRTDQAPKTSSHQSHQYHHARSDTARKVAATSPAAKPSTASSETTSPDAPAEIAEARSVQPDQSSRPPAIIATAQ